MAKASIPTIDLSQFIQQGDENGKRKALEKIGDACENYGFFQIINHGVSPCLMSRAIELSTTFFGYPTEEKMKSKPIVGSNASLPAGYGSQPEISKDKNEYLLVLAPSDQSSDFNVYPTNPPGFRMVLEEVYHQLTKTALLVESILNECMGLPHNFLNNYNKDRSYDFMVALRYFPATDTEPDRTGISQHEDGNCITFVFQDGVGGLEVLRDGEWIPVKPKEGTIIVNVGDVMQVLSNKKLKSATHRVVRQQGKSRHSYAFFHNLHGDKWVEPLPQFTHQIGEPPKYKGFLYKDYQQHRLRNKTHPPPRPEDVINISYYALDT